MASKATVGRQRSSEKVAAAGRTHKQAVVQAVSQTFGEDAGPAAGLLIEGAVTRLEQSCDAMVAADDAHLAELSDDPAARARRDDRAEALHGRLVTLRDQLGTALGTEYVARLGFEGPTPTDPVEVLRLGTTVAERLGEVPAPEPVLPGFAYDPADWHGPLGDELGALDSALSEVADEEREAEATLTAKREAIAVYDRVFSGTAGLISALLRVAGQDELAARVRPSTRRSGQTVEDAAETVETD